MLIPHPMSEDRWLRWKDIVLLVLLLRLRCLCFVGVVVVVALPFGNAHADLINTIPSHSTCGGRVRGIEKIGTVTDPVGDVFTLNCVNGDFYQGSVFVKSTGITTPFGKCVFEGGLNTFNYEVDANNNFKEIAWVNVNPPGNISSSEILGSIQNSNDDPTDVWLARVRDYLRRNNLEGNENNRIYEFPFSPNNQTVGVFTNGILASIYTLTPDQAILAYRGDGSSSLPGLAIDPIKRQFGATFQVAGQPVPEPQTIYIFLVGLVGAALVSRQRWRASLNA